MAMQESFELKRENLFAATQMMPIVADKMTIAKSGVLKRGSLLDETGALIAAADTAVYAVLAEDVDTTNAAKDAPVYLTGEFNENGVIVGGDISAADVKASARKVGIFLKPSIK